MNDEIYELASAFIDGELTESERERALANPKVMAAVDELAPLSSLLTAVPDFDDATRASAIAQALETADFDDASFRAPNPQRFRRVSAVAAAIVLLVGGVTLFRQLSSGETSDTATHARSGSVRATSTARAVPESPMEQATESFAERVDEHVMSAESSADTTDMLGSAAADTAQPAASARSDAGGEADEQPEVASETGTYLPSFDVADLALRGDQLLSRARDNVLIPVAKPACEVASLVEHAIMTGDDGKPVEVYVSVQVGDARVDAIAVATCVTIASVPLAGG